MAGIMDRSEQDAHIIMGYERMVQERNARIEALEQRLAAAELNAARYEWLKANHLQTGPDSWIRTGDDLEEAIDAARGKP